MRTKGRRPRRAPASDGGSLDVALSVLGYREDGEWVALALEMDLRGYGASFEEACAELSDLVRMQVDFARFKAQPELLMMPAEPQWWQLYSEARAKHLARMVRSEGRRSSGSPTYRVAGLRVPAATRRRSTEPAFVAAGG
jgi:hypothetical protein